MNKSGEEVQVTEIYRAVCMDHGDQRVALLRFEYFPMCAEGQQDTHEIVWELLREIEV